MNNYKPEGWNYNSAENQKYIASVSGLADAMERNVILEGGVIVCDSSHNLIVNLPCGRAIIPREEGALGISDGSPRDIALISRVNKIVCFKVLSISDSPNEKYCAVLSRKDAQNECMENYINHLEPGDVIDARVTHMEKFGCFVDIGCGVSSLIPIDAISVSRIAHPSDRFTVGEKIRAIVRSRENGRICLTHKELLGTWEENASEFCAGETVSGIVRSIEDYGIFVELAPNLAGLAESKAGIKVGQYVSVFIKVLIPEKMKVKLIIVEQGDETVPQEKNKYYFSGNKIESWNYAPLSSEKKITSYFN